MMSSNISIATPEGITSSSFYIAATFSLIAVIGILGNSLVILAVGISRSLQTPTNIFLTSLSVADLLTCCLLPLQSVALLQSDEGCFLPNWLCQGIAYLSCVCNISSVLHLLIIAITRCIFLSGNNAIKYAHLRTNRNVAILIATAWLLPTTLYTIPVLTGVRRLGYHQKLRICLFKEDANTMTRIYVALVCVIYSATLFTIIICHVQILRTVYNQQFSLTTFDKTARSPSERLTRLSEDGSCDIDDDEYDDDDDDDDDDNEKADNKNHDLKRDVLSLPFNNNYELTSVINKARDSLKPYFRERRQGSVVSHIDIIIMRQLEITKYLIYVTTAFIVCVMPTCFCLVTPKCYNNYLSYFLIPLMINSCINPLIYSLKDRSFHDVFGAVLHCRLTEL